MIASLVKALCVAYTEAYGNDAVGKLQEAAYKSHSLMDSDRNAHKHFLMWQETSEDYYAAARQLYNQLNP